MEMMSKLRTIIAGIHTGTDVYYFAIERQDAPYRDDSVSALCFPRSVRPARSARALMK